MEDRCVEGNVHQIGRTTFRYVDELLYWSGRRLTLDECLHDDLTPHRLTPTWVAHDKFVYQADDGSLTLLDTSNNSVSLLVSNHTLVRITQRLGLQHRETRKLQVNYLLARKLTIKEKIIIGKLCFTCFLQIYLPREITLMN